MATQYDPIAKDASLNTTENPSRNLADVIAQSLASLIAAMPATVLNNLADVVITLPTDGQTLKYDAVSQKWVNADDAGGHTIEDPNGTALSQESTLQFADADATDDAVNEKTVVNVVRKRTQAQYDLMSAADKAKGVIEITDADAKPLFASQVRYGAGTVEDALDKTLYQRLIPDGTKKRYYGSCVYDGNNTNKYVVILNLPVPTSMFSSITCDCFRQTNIATPIDTNPTIVIENEFQISISSSINFSSFVGRLFCADLVFNYIQ